MPNLIENAIHSIQLGIEDYKSNDPRRPVSAVRNFYAGVLLLGKQCLLSKAPNADPMEVLASNYVPAPDEDGNISYEPVGQKTIDFGELQSRFKKFGLEWPKGNVKRLQKIRNDLEHLFSSEPHDAMKEAIATCFPTIQGFFDILGIEPADALGDTWDDMLSVKAFYTQQKTECDDSLAKLPWGQGLYHTDQYECHNCGSALVKQLDPKNAIADEINGKCLACGTTIEAQLFVEIVVAGEFGSDDYVAFKDGGEHIISDCLECGNGTYVEAGEPNGCWYCEYIVEGDCLRCSTSLSAQNVSADNDQLCSYCDHVINKDD